MMTESRLSLSIEKILKVVHLEGDGKVTCVREVTSYYSLTDGCPLLWQRDPMAWQRDPVTGQKYPVPDWLVTPQAFDQGQVDQLQARVRDLERWQLEARDCITVMKNNMDPVVAGQSRSSADNNAYYFEPLAVKALDLLKRMLTDD
jgi:hypothetical protein